MRAAGEEIGMGKLLTIAVPSYNVEAYLERGLESFADDRLEELLEVIVVDDGSTDSTPCIAASFAERHPGIFRVISKENGGHGSAVNAGLAHAQGKYFRVVDGDDWVVTDNLVELLRRMSMQDADAVVDEMTRVDMSTMQGSHQALPSFVEDGACVPFDQVCNRGDLESYIDIHTLTVKTDLLRAHDVRLREGIFYVDYEFIVKATCFVKAIAFFRLDIYQYLVGNAAQSMDAANMVKRYTHHEAVLRELLSFEAEGSFSPVVSEYLKTKIKLLIHTHYNILLIFDQNRKRGKMRADEFDSWLKAEHPAYYEMTAKRRRQARVLHALGFDAAKLNKLMGR